MEVASHRSSVVVDDLALHDTLVVPAGRRVVVVMVVAVSSPLPVLGDVALPLDLADSILSVPSNIL